MAYTSSLSNNFLARPTSCTGLSEKFEIFLSKIRPMVGIEYESYWGLGRQCCGCSRFGDLSLGSPESRWMRRSGSKSLFTSIEKGVVLDKRGI